MSHSVDYYVVKHYLTTLFLTNPYNLMKYPELLLFFLRIPTRLLWITVILYKTILHVEFSGYNNWYRHGGCCNRYCFLRNYVDNEKNLLIIKYLMCRVACGSRQLRIRLSSQIEFAVTSTLLRLTSLSFKIYLVISFLYIERASMVFILVLQH